MNGNAKVVDGLQALLKSELQSIHQYTGHAAVYRNSGYKKLAHTEEDRAQQEMNHASKLMRRICLLGALPIVDNLDKRTLDDAAEDIIESDIELELAAVVLYNDVVALCQTEESDADTRLLLEHILKDETKHIRILESQLKQIQEMGIQNFLSANT